MCKFFLRTSEKNSRVIYFNFFETLTKYSSKLNLITIRTKKNHIIYGYSFIYLNHSITINDLHNFTKFLFTSR